MSNDVHALRRLAIRAADRLPLPAIVESFGRREDLSSFLDAVEQLRGDVPRSVARLLGAEELTYGEAVEKLRDYHVATAILGK